MNSSIKIQANERIVQVIGPVIDVVFPLGKLQKTSSSSVEKIQ